MYQSLLTLPSPQKNKKNTAARLELEKYCRFERKVTKHKETK